MGLSPAWAVVRLDAEEHDVLVVLHKAITDDYSMWIVLDELSTAYAAALDGLARQLGWVSSRPSTPSTRAASSMGRRRPRFAGSGTTPVWVRCSRRSSWAGRSVLCRIGSAPTRRKFVDWLAEERITFLQTVPSFARELVAVLNARGSPDRLASLDRLVLMGEALRGDLANALRVALPFTRLANVYGPTETIAATWHDITGELRGMAPIGRSIPGRQILVLDHHDRPCPTGVTGEIVIRSPYVADGYVGDSARDDVAFRPVPGLEEAAGAGIRCYRTGDLGRLLGLLEFRGRRRLSA